MIRDPPTASCCQPHPLTPHSSYRSLDFFVSLFYSGFMFTDPAIPGQVFPDHVDIVVAR